MRTERATRPLVIDDTTPKKCPLCCQRQILWTYRGCEGWPSRPLHCLRCFIRIMRPEFLQETGPLRSAMAGYTAELDEWQEEGRSRGELRSMWNFKSDSITFKPKGNAN